MTRRCSRSRTCGVDHGDEPIVDGVDFDARARARRWGSPGESGCGKTTTALALMKLLPPA